MLRKGLFDALSFFSKNKEIDRLVANIYGFLMKVMQARCWENCVWLSSEKKIRNCEKIVWHIECLCTVLELNVTCVVVWQ